MKEALTLAIFLSAAVMSFPATFCRIGFGANQYEVVVHDWVPLDAVTLRYKFLFCALVVHKQDIRVTAFGDVDRLARAYRRDFDGDTSGGLEFWQQVRKEARLLSGSRRGHLNGFVLR